MHISAFVSLVLQAAVLVEAHNHKAKRGRRAIPASPAFNQTPHNIVPQAPGGPVLFYNGSGPVPPINELSPSPASLPALSNQEVEDNLFTELLGIVAGNGLTDSCSVCIAATELLHITAITQPASTITNLALRACNEIPYVFSHIFSETCENEYAGTGNRGPYLAQLFAKLSVATGDMQAYCFYNYEVCDQPPTMAINESAYFKPKPANKTTAPASSGKTINVVHLSDWHLDSRYDIGSEANCTGISECCRFDAINSDFSTTAANASLPASRFGEFFCDSPADLALSVFSNMDQFMNRSLVAFSIFTGDLVSHDDDDQLSRAYVAYEETITFQTFKAQMGNSPVFATLGNHDTVPIDSESNTPNSMNINGTNIFSWNYDILSGLWEDSNWITKTQAEYASLHYGAYATVTQHGLKIISLNTEFWYAGNNFNFINMTNPDNSGILTFLADELQKSEDIDQRVWIIGHVPSGYDGGSSLPNPTALFYSIVARFSPTTIAGVFFGHTHEDQLQIFYDYLPNSTIQTSDGSIIRNTTLVDFNKPLQVAFIGPSITPLFEVNSGWTLYQIDSETFSVSDSQTFFANISNSAEWSTPVWEFEYDSRATYDPENEWPRTAPLNATFWDRVAEKMLSNITLVEEYNFLETKKSVLTEPCTTSLCQTQKVCFIRSGSAAMGLACTQIDDDDNP